MAEPQVPFKVKSLFEYSSTDEDDLVFAANKIITVTFIEDESWYTGTLDGKTGMFPKSFVEIVPADPVKTPHAPVIDEEDHLDKTDQLSEPTKQLDKDDDTEDEKAPEIKGEPKKESVPPLPASSQAPGSSTKAGPTKTPAFGNKVPMPNVPLPMPMTQRKEDPYAIKKQFIGAGKSSYVPPVVPRDTSNVAHGFHDTPKSSEIVRENDAPKDTEESEPKMSLKERIAMLETSRRLEAEREEAARKKEEEKKAKAALKRQNTASLIESVEISKHKTGESFAETSPLQTHVEASESVPEIKEDDAIDSNFKLTTKIAEESDSDEEEAEDDDKQDAAKEVNKYDVEAAEQTEKTEEVEEADDAEEEEAEDEDDEDVKRRRLVERMAKISGGRNMFGMMGMATPFGAPKTDSPSAKRTNSTKKVTKPEEKQNDSVPSAPSVPVLPPSAMALPGMAHPVEKAIVVDSEEATAATEKAPEPERPELGSVESLPAELETNEEETELVNEEEEGIIDEDESEEYKEGNELEKDVPESIHLTSTAKDSVLEDDATGYQADEEVSDRGGAPMAKEKLEKPPSRTSSHKVPPPPPGVSHVPPPPPHSSGPHHPPPPPPPSHALPPRPPPPGQAPSVPSGPPPAQMPPVPPHGMPPVPPLPPAPPVPSEAPPPVSRGPPSGEAPIPPIPTAGPVEARKFAPPPMPLGRPEQIDQQGTPESTATLPPQTLSARGTVDDDEDIFSPLDSADLHYGSGPKSLGLQKSKTFFHAPTHPPIPESPLQRRSSLNDAIRTSSGISRKSSIVSNKNEIDLAETDLQELTKELDDLKNLSAWWIKNAAPHSLQLRIGTDLIYEVDTHQITKRNGRVVVYKDYYILYHDLSQIIIELQYDQMDPRETASLNGLRVETAPVARKDVLRGFASDLGAKAARAAEYLEGKKFSDGLINGIIEDLTSSGISVLLPVGQKAYGFTVYKVSNGAVSKADDIRPGDIVCMRNAKFPSHKGLKSLALKPIVLGENNFIYSAVVIEYDAKKDKIKVMESDPNGIVRKEGYRLGEMKSGHLRIFRLVKREYIGWPEKIPTE